MRTSFPWRAAVAAALGGTALVLSLAGCASTSSAAPSASADAAREDRNAPQDAQDRGGVFGLIAAVSDDTLQVQGTDEQTSVRYDGDTTVQRTTTISASSIDVGDCVMAVTGQDDEDAATTVTVSEPDDDGSCRAGFGGRGGAGGDAPGDMPTDMPTDMPQGRGMPSAAPSGMPQDGSMPSGAPGGARGFGGFTVGTVTAASDTSLTVQTTSQDGSTASEDVTISSDTTVTTTVDASAGDIAEGLCVRAAGEADDKGGFDASALTLSDASSDGACSSGFGFEGAGQRPGSGQ